MVEETSILFTWYLIAKSNYTVETAVKIKEYANQVEEFNAEELIYHLSQTPDLPLISFKGRRSKDPVRDKLANYGLFSIEVGNPEATAVSLIQTTAKMYINNFCDIQTFRLVLYIIKSMFPSSIH